MYDYIKEAVDSGKVMLEWDYSKGQPTVPLVKGKTIYIYKIDLVEILTVSIEYITIVMDDDRLVVL